MLNILIDAYAVSPTWGSEPGMGWNWVCNLARYCNLYVITEGEWQDAIERAMNAAFEGIMEKDVNPTGLHREQAERIHFYYLNVSPKVRKMCWKQGTWMFYKHYAAWEKRALTKAREIIEQLKVQGIRIDVVHKLNMIGFREPGYLWKIIDIPFVWGPIGGYGSYPYAFLCADGNLMQSTKICLKNIINWFSFRFLPRVRMSIKRADAVVGAYKETFEAIRDFYRDDVVLINETGTIEDIATEAHVANREEFSLMWVGKFDLRKQLGLAIQTMNLLKHKKNIHLYVVGTGSSADVVRYTQMVDRFGLKNNVHLMGVIPNLKTREMMKNMDLFFFTSVSDATSTVVPEAISAGLPILCHNTCGFGVIVDYKIGYKVEVKNPDYSISEFARIIEDLESHREEVRRLSLGCIERQKEISWEANAQKMVAQYEYAISHFYAKNKLI